MRHLIVLFLACFISTAFAEPALYTAKGPDRTLYLFGTMHMLPKTDWMSEKIASRLAGSDRLVMELPPDDLSPVKSAAAILHYGLDDDNVPLREELKPDLRARYEARMTALGGPPLALFDRFKPWVAAVTIGSLTAQNMGITGESGAEGALISKAEADGRPIVGLESVDQQLQIFDQMTRPMQYKLLDDSIKDSETAATEIKTLVKNWLAGDATALGAYFEKSEKEEPQISKIVIDDRNKAWVGKLTGPDYRGTSFVAVGFAHLTGPEGLIAQLKAKGYKVTRD